MSRRAGASGVATGDVLLVMAALVLVAALVYPVVRGRAFRAEMAAVVTQVDDFRAAAEAHLDLTGDWPGPGDPGAPPGDLRGGPFRGTLSGDDYVLQWARWEVIDSIDAPPSPGPPPIDGPAPDVEPARIPDVRRVGGVVVRTGREEILGELLRHYGSASSFVRDSTWTLVLPRRGAGS